MDEQVELWIHNDINGCARYGERGDATVAGCMHNELFVC